MKKFLFIAFLFLGILNNLWAENIAFNKVLSGSGWGGVAVDSVTGKVYTKGGYNSDLIKVYDSLTDFDVGNNSSSFYLQGNGTVGGTYMAVKNGKIFARYDKTSNTIARYSATNGNLEATQTISGVTGGNSGFNWGGYTNLNWMNDGQDLYVFGWNNSLDHWQVAKVDEDLNVLETKTHNISTRLGYSFMINGRLYTGPYYYQDQIDTIFDLATGSTSSVDYTITGVTGGYRDNLSYDSYNNVLFVHEQGDGFFMTGNASTRFDAPNSIPEPGVFVLLLLGIGLIIKFKQ